MVGANVAKHFKCSRMETPAFRPDGGGHMPIFEPKHYQDDIRTLRGYFLTFAQNWDDDPSYRQDIITITVSLIFVGLFFFFMGFVAGRLF